MYFKSYCCDNKYVFLKNSISIAGRTYNIEAGKYEVSTGKIRSVYPSEVKRCVIKYVEKSEVDIVVNVIVKIRKLLNSENLKYCPSMRFHLVRVCSALGIEPNEQLRDLYPSNIKAKHEFLFYGIIVPTIDLNVSNCKYFHEWYRDLRQRARDLGNVCIGPEWIDWNDRWEEFWYREGNGMNDKFIMCGRGR
ncbi:Hypothetical predicted protein [Paramuricea clavata]|uniref:Uncharacterized protein n=1 Tax=Paramuricea clavata TaxID=317549 RepID=A0A7D9LFJ1_PARCT|nr:Hypothetical predicted protein [Paramuricea clavata]